MSSTAEIIIPKNFPKDLINYILKYVYNPLPEKILRDITNFVVSKNHILNHYFNIFVVEFGYSPTDYIDWAVNDIYGFMNDHVASMNGYVPNFYKIMLRNPFIHPFKRSQYFKNNTLLDNSDYTYKVFMYIDRLNQLTPEHNFNILWGLLKPKERVKFMNTYLYNL
jgi:hypothetical protein